MVFYDVVEHVGMVIDGAGVVVIVIGSAIASALAINRFQHDVTNVYTRYRRELGRTILLGLELLVAGDIIRTVAAEPTLTSIGVLAGIVLIRTFLSFSLELEITGRWPWQKSPITSPESGGSTGGDPS
ncbi:DUF1622 domain-containing protein [Jatrophihabitans sp. DSM 45814]